SPGYGWITGFRCPASCHSRGARCSSPISLRLPSPDGGPDAVTSLGSGAWLASSLTAVSLTALIPGQPSPERLSPACSTRPTLHIVHAPFQHASNRTLPPRRLPLAWV
ncbi:hypothetical protein BU16DRAFT_618457, partial [Lophium mytilinum]